LFFVFVFVFLLGFFLIMSYSEKEKKRTCDFTYEKLTNQSKPLLFFFSFFFFFFVDSCISIQFFSSFSLSPSSSALLLFEFGEE